MPSIHFLTIFNFIYFDFIKFSGKVPLYKTYLLFGDHP